MHLLLVVVLALGVFVMHTLGHPEDASGSGMSGVDHTTAAEPAHIDVPAPAVEHDSVENSPSAGLPPRASSDIASPPQSVDPHPVGMGMDMTALCMAVLGTWAFAALLYAALIGRIAWVVGLPGRAVAPARPDPPLPRTVLAQLSVLRI
ncbi:hypothetical protein [Streptomyces sp. M2CJ-2]|uniref:hypothetical protein n=1 Tax=Streptomyces sp. M2CJ-2 TaxID=2803948 RepID=UPI0027DD2AD8|nr:hypothetical protein [Streptomyces sp. M2CJ-2]